MAWRFTQALCPENSGRIKYKVLFRARIYHRLPLGGVIPTLPSESFGYYFQSLNRCSVTMIIPANQSRNAIPFFNACSLEDPMFRLDYYPVPAPIYGNNVSNSHQKTLIRTSFRKWTVAFLHAGSKF